MSLYEDIILDHYKHPQNYGKLENATHEAHAKNPLCGDELTMKVRIEENKVTDVKFEGQGCAISMATASLLTEELKGKSLDEIQNYEPKDLLELIEVHLSPVRMKCALLSLEVAKSLR